MRNSHIDTSDFLWLGLILLVILNFAFLIPITPQDYWWYLRIGREILATGSIPTTDALTFSQIGQPVTYHSWGAAVLFWLIYRVGSLPLTVLLRGLSLAATYGLVWWTTRRAGGCRLSTALALLVAVLASSNNWSVRPQLFAYLLFAASLFILYQWQNGMNKLLIWLPVIGLLWVNLHGSFVMLILLAGVAFVFGNGNRRALGLALALVFAATFINPRGIGAWTYVVNSLIVPSSQSFSAEWLPPVNEGWQMNLFFLWLLIFPLLVVLSPRKLNRLEWTWFLGFGFLALWGERYVIWFIFLFAVLTALLIANWEKSWLGKPKLGIPALNLALGIIIILLPLAILPGMRETWWLQAPPTTENTPIEATKWLAEHPDLPGPLWSEIGFSSYLEFALASRPTWIDTRFEVFPVEQWEQYRDISNAAWNWESLLEQTGANLIIISIQNQPELLVAVKMSPNWCKVYQDDEAALYQRGPCAER